MLAADHDVPATFLEAVGYHPALTAFEGIMARDQRTLDSIVISARSSLWPFDDPDVLRATDRADFTSSDLLEPGRNGALFVAGSAFSQRDYRGLYATCVESVVRAAYEQSGRQDRAPDLLIVLDEATNIAPLPNLDYLATTAQGCGIQLAVLMHDTAQAEQVYGRAATKVLVNSFPVVVLLGGLTDPEADRMVAEAGGAHLPPLRALPLGQARVVAQGLPPFDIEIESIYRGLDAAV